jgi:hypothetical protein
MSGELRHIDRAGTSAKAVTEVPPKLFIDIGPRSAWQSAIAAKGPRDELRAIARSGPLGLRSGASALFMESLARIEDLITEYNEAPRAFVDVRMVVLDEILEEIQGALSLVKEERALRGQLPEVTSLLEGAKARGEIKRRYFGPLLETMSSAAVVIFFLEPPEEPAWRDEVPEGMGESPLLPAGMGPSEMRGLFDAAYHQEDVMGLLGRLYAEWRGAMKKDPRTLPYFLWLESR